MERSTVPSRSGSNGSSGSRRPCLTMGGPSLTMVDHCRPWSTMVDQGVSRRPLHNVIQSRSRPCEARHHAHRSVSMHFNTRYKAFQRVSVRTKAVQGITKRSNVFQGVPSYATRRCKAFHGVSTYMSRRTLAVQGCPRRFNIMACQLGTPNSSVTESHAAEQAAMSANISGTLTWPP